MEIVLYAVFLFLAALVLVPVGMLGGQSGKTSGHRRESSAPSPTSFSNDDNTVTFMNADLTTARSSFDGNGMSAFTNTAPANNNSDNNTWNGGSNDNTWNGGSSDNTWNGGGSNDNRGCES